MKCRRLIGHDGLGQGGGLVLNQAARVDQRPGEDDVLADRIGPAADRSDVLGPVRRERALGDQRAVVGGLGPLDAVDPQPVVPSLHAGEEVLGCVRGDQGAGTGAHVLVLRPARHARDQVHDRCRVRHGVGVDGHHDRRGDVDQRRVERVMLAGHRLEAPPVFEPEAACRSLGQLRRPVGRVVVGQDDRQRAGVAASGDAVEGPLDRVLLVVGRDDHRYRRPLAGRPRTRGRSEGRRAVAGEDQREAHEADHERRDVRHQDRDHPRHHRADCSLELAAPHVRDRHGEHEVGDGQGHGKGEPQGRSHPERGMRSGGEAAQLSLSRVDVGHARIMRARSGPRVTRKGRCHPIGGAGRCEHGIST